VIIACANGLSLLILNVYLPTDYTLAAPRILRWGYKTGFASEASKKNFVPPLFQMWGYRQANRCCNHQTS